VTDVKPIHYQVSAAEQRRQSCGAPLEAPEQQKGERRIIQMISSDIIRAWKDQDHRLSLTPAEQAQLPDNPAGLLELLDADLEQVTGGSVSFQASVAVECNNSNNCVSAVCSAGCLNLYVNVDVDVSTKIKLNGGKHLKKLRN